MRHHEAASDEDCGLALRILRLTRRRWAEFTFVGLVSFALGAVGCTSSSSDGGSSSGGEASTATGVSGAATANGGSAPTDDGNAASGAGSSNVAGAVGAECQHLSVRTNGYAFELKLTNTSEFYKVDFPASLMPHCVDQLGADGKSVAPDTLQTKCEASYLFKRDASAPPPAAVTESFVVLIPYVPADGFDITLAKGGKGRTDYELRGLDGSLWVTFDSTQKTVHIAREMLTPGGLGTRLPATPNVGPKRGAYLFPWYGSPTGPAGHWVHWDPNAPTLYTPTKGRYDSADRAVIAQQMQEAKSAGLDLFVVSYWDNEAPPLATYLDAAATAGLELSAMLETSTRRTGSPRESVVAQLTELRDNYASHPAWLKAGGKPIVFIYSRVSEEIEADKVGATAWDDWTWVAEQLAPNVPLVMFPLGGQWSARGAALFGGAFAFAANSGGGSYYTGSHGDDWSWMWTARQAGALVAIPILPSIGRLRTSADAPNYQNQWHAARSVMPDMIIVNSWNEYHESTIIEPTTLFGTEYLELTRTESELSCRGELGTLRQ
ncbi:MAG TPA: hypothetical protein VIV60_31315 [Polyangiaceae bacterium]